MAVVFNPTAEETRALEALIAELPRIQDTLVQNHPQLTRPDRGAHQQQLAGSKVLNPGNWQETTDVPEGQLPSTRFTAARFLAYRRSQQHRRGT